jgi:hypothetical protein
MDTFFEQIVTIKKTTKTMLSFVGIWAAALLLVALAFLFSGYIGAIFIFVIAGIIYGAFKLSGRLNVEYEYIVTNTTLDVDKITNKSTRLRMLSVELPTASRVEKYNPALLNNIDLKKLVFACDQDSQDAYLLVCEKEGKGAQYLVFTPNEKMQSAIVKTMPKFVANSAFK